ncbi:diphosphomevalonate decarboxylase [Polaribacter pacificus]|uniref:Diphosphomevalonate decarboxylase n=1 Tax=Polaribacter pacificus TaxID=1775173 RepID=A0A917HZ36_9FLAO|nr:diphosphomevalonate decarboxylase [Polaribacter pacificus]GGG96806.1 diphosphomevalonate decarboxylase [Polaribacter pacificus]
MSTAQFIPDTLAFSIEKTSHSWQTPSNIALVKYWGKTDPQIPKNASISFTLNACHTNTKIDFVKKSTTDEVQFELFFEGKKKEDFKPKIAKFFERILIYCPYLQAYQLTIHSDNSFPHSSGIASSASGMAAIAMCLMSLEKELNPNLTEEQIHKKASFLARLGSGSASRSIEGPIVVWGEHPAIEGSSNLYGVRFPYAVHPVFEEYQDTILLVDKGEKQVSSTVGHDLMHQHPFATQRFVQANENLEKMSQILKSGDLTAFIHLVESEALTLHAMMLTSSPYFILMKPNTLEIINRVWAYRAATASSLCFTLDAGANVHLLYPKEEAETVVKFIKEELSVYCQKNQYICDYTGHGAKKI